VQILIFNLGYRNIELVPQPVFEALHHMALLFERMGLFNAEFQSQHANGRHMRGVETERTGGHSGRRCAR
jgi:hypothetical protein